MTSTAVWRQAHVTRGGDLKCFLDLPNIEARGKRKANKSCKAHLMRITQDSTQSI